MDEIRLTYGRVGDLYSGNIQIQVFPTRGFLFLHEFENVSFPRMMSKLAEAIRERKVDVQVTLFRTEVPGSSYRLDGQTVEVLRADPAAAISGMMPEARTVVVKNTPLTVPPSGLLRAGHDTIAEAFGDSIYCAANHDSRVECPGCGRWVGASSQWLTCTNAGCSIRLAGKMTGRTWFVVQVKALLELRLEKYYLPRSWNPRLGWISCGDLQVTFENFQKEREQCFKEINPGE